MEAQKQLHLTVHLQVSDPNIEVRVHVVKTPINPHPVLIAASIKAQMDVEHILGPCRKRKEVMVRRICAAILRIQEDRPLQEIASLLNYKDHSVVVYNLRKHPDYLKYDEEYQYLYQLIFNNYKSNFNEQKNHPG